MSEPALELGKEVTVLAIRRQDATYHERQMLYFTTASLVLIGAIVAIWTSWRLGLTLALIGCLSTCFGLAVTHAKELKRFQGDKP